MMNLWWGFKQRLILLLFWKLINFFESHLWLLGISNLKHVLFLRYEFWLLWDLPVGNIELCSLQFTINSFKLSRERAPVGFLHLIELLYSLENWFQCAVLLKRKFIKLLNSFKHRFQTVFWQLQNTHRFGIVSWTL